MAESSNDGFVEDGAEGAEGQEENETDLDMEELLISAVQKKPILFDMSNKKYKDAKNKEPIWMSISIDIGKDGK
jgi:hypothetical protein